MKEQYLAIIDVHSRIKIAEGETIEKAVSKLDKILEKAKSDYPNCDWTNSLRVFKVEEVKRDQT